MIVLMMVKFFAWAYGIEVIGEPCCLFSCIETIVEIAVTVWLVGEKKGWWI